MTFDQIAPARTATDFYDHTVPIIISLPRPNYRRVACCYVIPSAMYGNV